MDVPRDPSGDLWLETEVIPLGAGDAPRPPRAGDGEDALDGVDGAHALDGALQVDVDPVARGVVVVVVEHGGRHDVEW